MNDYGKPQNHKAQQDEQAHELIEQLSLLETVDRRITPEHVAERFRELLDGIVDDGPPGPADQHTRRILDQPGCGDQLIGPWQEYVVEHWAELLGLSGSLEAAIAATRSAAADIIADAQLKAKSVSGELRQAQETVAAARQLAEQIVAESRTEANKALERSVKMIRDAGDQAAQIISDARQEAEQILTAARNQQVQQTAWVGNGFIAVMHRDPATRHDTETEPETQPESEDPSSASKMSRGWITDWTTHAACKGMDPDELFVRGAAQNRAKLICRGCPVRTECLADALDNGIEFGVWGGMTERERRALLRRRPEVTLWRELLERARDEYERQSLDEYKQQQQEETAGLPAFGETPMPPAAGETPCACHCGGTTTVSIAAPELSGVSGGHAQARRPDDGRSTPGGAAG